MAANRKHWPLTISAPRLLVLSFAGAIGVGACLLFAARTWSGDTALGSFVDALFTAASAICVTGLTVRDIGSEFSPFGQAVVLVLIQIGGIGILTFSNFMLYLQTGRMTAQQRQLVQESLGALPSISTPRLLVRVIAYAVTIEAIGAAALTLRFMADFPFPRALWLGTFHSVSAFCNAGLGLFPDSMQRYRADLFVNVVLMTLIVLGGLGFLVLTDIGGWVRGAYRGPRRRLLYHTRVVLLTTALLIVGGAATVLALETNGAASTGPIGLRVMDSLFVSVTARTAGFNTVPTGYLTNGTLLIVILLMGVGGSPGSTAGGIKTTTLATMYALLTSRLRNRERVELLQRTVPEDTVSKAMITLTAFLLAAAAATTLLQVTELAGAAHHLNRGKFLEYLFEVVSALCTVGLSTGVTPGLSIPGKLVIVACMFMGRLGPLMIATSLIGTRRAAGISYPEDHLNIG